MTAGTGVVADSEVEVLPSSHTNLRTRLAPGAAAVGCGLLCLAASLHGAPIDEFLAAADRGHCIEDVVYREVSRLGDGDAAQLVSDALLALEQRKRQQRTLGCDGDIAAQAIAAGADPRAVLPATAAGL